MNWLRSFVAAARSLSFTKAAMELGLTQTAISQHIKALEVKLGAKLFVRRPRSLQLTDIGKAYLESVREALDVIEMSTSGLFGPDLKSTIVVRGSMAFTAWLAPRLGEFQRMHPNVGVKLVTSIWEAADDVQAVDLEVILSSQQHAKPNFKKLSDECIVPIICINDAKLIATPSDLANHELIHILGFDDHWARYLRAFGLTYDIADIKLMVDTSVAAMEMTAAGLGCAMVIERFATQAIALGRPVKIVGEPIALGQSHYTTSKSARTEINPAVDAFESWLQMQFAN